MGLGRIVYYLIEKGADLNIIDDDGQSALTNAYASFPNSDIVYKLITVGADVNAGGNDNCSLVQAIRSRDIRMLHELLQHPDITIPTSAGRDRRATCRYLIAESEIQSMFEDAYAWPIATRTRRKREQYQWRKMLKSSVRKYN
jgi:ankyrin repeat protein